ncbi:MAG TPA: lipopolysaccharide biosynthesis protein [Acidimicrobiales bacterium]|nr:lipopolysaccharide biosynthesis protein [Acidimicrobiales bacterium]
MTFESAPPADLAGDVPPPTPPRLQARVVKSFAWSAASLGGSRLMVFVSTVVLARLLAPREFGVVAVGITLTTYLEMALDLGVGSSIVYEQERGVTPRVQTAFTLNLLVAGFLTVVGFLAAPAVSRFFDVGGEVTLLRTIFLYFLFRGAGQVQDAVLKRDLEFKKRAIADVVSAAIRMAISIVLALAGYGAWSIVWGLLAGALTSTAIKWAQVRFRPQFRLDRAASTTLLRFGLTVTALKVLSTVGEDFDYVVVGHQLGPTQLGLYTMAYRLPELLVSSFFWIFSHVAFAAYSNARAEGSDMFRTAMLRALRFTTLFGFTVGTGLALVARDAIPVLFSDRWTAAVSPMVLISLAVGLASVGYASGDIFSAAGRPGLLLKLNGPLAIARVAGFVVAAQHGIVAVAAVHLAFSAVYPILRLAVANHIVDATFRDDLRAMRPGLSAAAGIVACALPVRLLTDTGASSLALICMTGTLGAIAGLALGAPSTFGEVRELVRLGRTG